MISKSIDIGPLTLHLYGLIIALAIYVGWYLAKKRAHLYQIPQKIFDDPILLIPLILSIIGARAYHVIDYWQFYKLDPISILNIAGGGLGIWGALVGLFVGFYIVTKTRKIDFLSALDLAAPSIILGQAIGRIGNYINKEGFGPPTDLPWGIFIEKDARPLEFINSSYFHPTFFYEAALNLSFFLILFLSFPRKRESSWGFSIRSRMTLKRPGQVFALYLIFYSISRFITEFWRIDTWVIGTIRIAHIISIIGFLIGVCLFINLRTIRKM